MKDITLTCLDCSQEFVWTEGEQTYYHEKSLAAPTLCLICRYRNKAKAADHHPSRKKPSSS